MALRMAQPWKHPKTGMYYLRRAVPKDLWTTIGKREVKQSLGTKDRDLAKQRFIAELAKCDARWAAELAKRDAQSAMLCGETQRLTEQEAHAIAAIVHDEWLLQHGENPTLDYWDPSLFARLWSEPDHERSGYHEALGLDELLIPRMRRMCRARTRGLIEELGLPLDILSHALLQRAVATAFQRASLKMRGVTDGTIDPQDYARMLSALRSTGQEQASPRPITPSVTTPEVSVIDLVERWWKEAEAAGRKPSTYNKYRNTIRGFAKFIGHNNASRITTDNVIAFKDHRLFTVSERTRRAASAKTVKDGDLAALKTVFGWAVDNRLMESNPAIGITVKLGKRVRLRSPGFTDVEAKSILRAALELMPGAEKASTSAAKKWVPWLCAFNGARVGEMAQLRKQDIRFSDGRWIIRVTPEAGTVKTNDAREIVLHRQLVSLGFPDFVNEQPDGYLFLRIGPSGLSDGPLRGLKNRLAEFSRSIVTDRGVDPTRGWRHRFKTIGMELGIEIRVLDAIQGRTHNSKSSSKDYGEVALKTIANAMDKWPDIDIANEL